LRRASKSSWMPCCCSSDRYADADGTCRDTAQAVADERRNE
jgi:hypothetical protein